jgi:7-cyano-7-deazaguanine tRNA-ribosyltransferase
MGGFKLILGTPLNAVPRPWERIRFPGVMVNAYEILTNSRRRSEVRGRGLRKLLGIGDDVELWIDSGGYQFLRRGIRPNPEKIIRLYKEVDADYYVSLDYPPGPRDPPETRARKIAKTVSTFIEFRSALRNHVHEGRLVPVFHLATGHGLEIQLREYEPTAVTAAVGGLIPHIMQRSGKGSRLKAVLFMTLVRRLWSGRLHALGLASAAMIPLLKAIGIDSGDTQTWRHKAAYGKIVIPGIGERHVSGRKVRFGPAVLRNEEELQLFRKYIAQAESEIGPDAVNVSSSFESRALFNAWILKTVSENNHGYNGASKAFANLYKTIEVLAKTPLEIIEASLEELLGEKSSDAIVYREQRSVESAPAAVTGLSTSYLFSGSR